MVAAYFNKTDYTTSNPKADGSIPKKKVISFKAGCDLTESESQPGKERRGLSDKQEVLSVSIYLVVRIIVAPRPANTSKKSGNDLSTASAPVTVTSPLPPNAITAAIIAMR